MTMLNKLNANHLAALDADTAGGLLAYLNLPPVGGFSDAAGPPSPTSNDAYELFASVRGSIRARREIVGGGFNSLDQLIGIENFGPSVLNEIVVRLGDVARYGNRLRPVWGGPESEREFFALLESAERYIHISTYIIGGEAGLRLARLLARKVREGVQARVLFCASGFVVSGSPSGTGFVSPFSEMRSYLLNDMYVRKRIIKEMRASGVPFINSSPIGRHWKRRALRAEGVRTPRDYERWARDHDVPDVWLDEQERIDRECGLAFANVDHRKMVIVDGDRAFVGSQNIADSYFYANELSQDPKLNVRRWQWHDSSAILEGGSAASLNRLFARRWVLSGGDFFDSEDAFYAPLARRAGNAVVTIETSIPGMLRLPIKKNLPRLLWSVAGADRRPVTEGHNPIRDRVLKLPEQAKNDLYVEHCYPSDARLIEHWCGQAASVPDFNMIVPLHYDTKVLGDECDRFYPEMIAAGANLWGYNRAIMHSKVIVADGWYSSVGSYNLTLRSGRADLELQFFIQCPEFGGAIRDRVRDDLKECLPVRPGLFARYRSRRSIPIVDAVIRYLFL
jgi:phosphatidylserine/phosphatidylglycerophosphate/cardiolipin synthase-like enzyme